MLNRNSLTRRRLAISAGLLAVSLIGIATTNGCGSSTSAGAVVVTGVMSGSRSPGHRAVALNTLTVSCVTFTVPPIAGTGTVGSDGSFSVNLPGAANSPFGCFVLQGTTQLATLIVQDPSNTGMNGQPAASSQLTAGGSTSLGAIVLNTTTGQAVATSTNVTGLITAATDGTNTDFTGNYKIAAVDSATAANFPAYSGACAVGASNCNGPTLGQSIFLKVLHGKAWTAGATNPAGCAANHNGPITDGTCVGTSSGDKYGITVWGSAAGFATCGSKLGFTYDDAKANGHIDLTGVTGISDGPQTWTSAHGSLTGSIGNLETNTANLGFSWADVSATFAQGANGGMAPQDCGPTTVSGGGHNGLNGWACQGSTDMTGATGNGVWSVGLGNGGGCVLTGTSTSVQPTSAGWTSMSSCGSPASQGDGFTSNSQCGASVQYTLPNTNSNSTLTGAVTCTNVGGTFTTAAATTPSAGAYNTTHLLAAASTSMDTALLNGGNPANLRLAAMQGLANLYQNIQNHYQVGNGGTTQATADSVCLPKVQFNWGAASVNNYLLSGGPQQALNEYVLELLTYNTPTSASFTQNQSQVQGAQDHSGNWVPCQVQSTTNMNINAVPGSTNLFVTFVQQAIMTDSNPACYSASVNGLGTQRAIFLLTPQ